VLTPHQFYRRVAFGLTEKDDIKNPLGDSVKQLSNTNSVSWKHINPTNLDAIKYKVIVKDIENRISEQGGNFEDRKEAFKKEGIE